MQVVNLLDSKQSFSATVHRGGRDRKRGFEPKHASKSLCYDQLSAAGPHISLFWHTVCSTVISGKQKHKDQTRKWNQVLVEMKRRI